MDDFPTITQGKVPTTGLGPGKSNGTSTHSTDPVAVHVEGKPPSAVVRFPGVAHILAT